MAWPTITQGLRRNDNEQTKTCCIFLYHFSLDIYQTGRRDCPSGFHCVCQQPAGEVLETQYIYAEAEPVPRGALRSTWTGQ